MFKGDTWYAIYEPATGRLHATGTRIAGKKTLAENGLAFKALDFNPQDPPEEDGFFEWNEKTLEFTAVGKAAGLRRSAAALRTEADRLEALAVKHDALQAP